MRRRKNAFAANSLRMAVVSLLIWNTSGLDEGIKIRPNIQKRIPNPPHEIESDGARSRSGLLESATASATLEFDHGIEAIRHPSRLETTTAQTTGAAPGPAPSPCGNQPVADCSKSTGSLSVSTCEDSFMYTYASSTGAYRSGLKMRSTSNSLFHIVAFAPFSAVSTSIFPSKYM